MNFSEAFEKYDQQGWDDVSKLNLILNFLDQNSDTIITPYMFDDFLKDVADEENEEAARREEGI